MTFLNPALLAAGLACVSIPIIIHLLMHRRRKPVVWGAMRFLLEAYRRQQRRLMLEKWLLLICRCLLVVAVALAIGKPMLGGAAAGSRSATLFILVDNGVGSTARGGGGSGASGESSLERAKREGKALLSELRSRGGEGNRAALITLGGPAEGLIVPPTTDLAAVETLLEQIEATDGRADFAGGLALVSAALAPVGGATVIEPEGVLVALLSDFREGDLSTTGTESTRPARLPRGVRVLAMEPASDTPGNVAITDVEPLRSVLLTESSDPSAELVRVSLRRTQTPGAESAASTQVWARLATPGSDEPVRPTQTTTVRWQPGQETAVAVVPLAGLNQSLTGGSSGAQRASGVLVAGIEEGDAISADNRFRRGLDVRDALRVGVIAPSRFGRGERADQLDPGSWARLALAPGGEKSGVDVIEIEPAAIDSARLAGLDAVLLARPDMIPEGSWARIKAFVDAGGMAIVCPPPGVTVHLWGDAMTRALGADWSTARESVAQESVKPALVRRAPGEASGLLGLIEGELGDLLSAVTITRALPLEPAPEHGQTLLTLGEGGPALLWAGGPTGEGAGDGRGLVVYLGVALDLEWSDLPAKPLMVPLVQELVRQGVGQARGAYVAVAGSRPGAPSRSVVLESVPDPAAIGSRGVGAGGTSNAARVPAPVRVDSAGQVEFVRRAGVYRALDETGATRGLVTVNADPRGTRTGAQPKRAIETWFAQGLEEPESAGAAAERTMAWIGTAPGSGPRWMAAAVASGGSGSPAWWPLLVAALALCVLELAVARWSSHASVTGSSATEIVTAAAPLAKEAA